MLDEIKKQFFKYVFMVYMQRFYLIFLI